MHRWFLWSAATVSLALIAGGLFVHRAAVEEGIVRNQLAALSQIEVNAAREWRARSGFKRELATGDKGNDVVLLQKTLVAKKLLASKDATGFYGSLTKKGVQSLQRAWSLPATGAVDEATRARLNEAYRGIVCPRPAAAYPDFSRVNVGKSRLVPYDYAPADLAELSANSVWTNGVVCMRKEAGAALLRMIGDAAKEGVRIGITSGFRSADIQKALYDYWHMVGGNKADGEIAPPGGSEHQLGTAADLTGASAGYAGTPPDFAKRPEGRWLTAHAREYGFALSYPRGREGITGYIYEPWHWRYVGKETAAAIAEGSVGTAEYLAAHAGNIPRLRGIPEGLDLTAAAALAVYVPRGFRPGGVSDPGGGTPHVLVQKDSERPHPIASVTKLLTAVVAEKLFPPGKRIPVSAAAAQEAVNPRTYGVGAGAKEGQSVLQSGDALSIEDMLALLLIESSNPAARALADAYGYEQFIGLMRGEAARLELSTLVVANPTGLDPKNGESLNAASARDLAVLLREVLDNHPALRTLLGTPEAQVRSTGGAVYRARTTNNLLLSSAWPEGVLGGKTGETPRASQALVFAAQSPSGDGYVLGVLLESADRFTDAEKVLRWLRDSYEWE
ncbi:MAG: D-alanyl-D-alanine carboxypeptidase family protein [Candidatus Liptonbacteria bacterium]|nr:D-alanyl-D-alanine carboxypeptidase family protein [Candidatus Liptonbacteria bacterium]